MQGAGPGPSPDCIHHSGWTHHDHATMGLWLGGRTDVVRRSGPTQWSDAMVRRNSATRVFDIPAIYRRRSIALCRATSHVFCSRPYVYPNCTLIALRTRNAVPFASAPPPPRRARVMNATECMTQVSTSSHEPPQGDAGHGTSSSPLSTHPGRAKEVETVDPIFEGQDDWVGWAGPVWCSRYGRFESQEDAARDDGPDYHAIHPTARRAPTRHGHHKHEGIEELTAATRKLYQESIQRLLEPIVASVVRLEEQIEQITHHLASHGRAGTDRPAIFHFRET
jgi:hypothetical protein